MTKTNIITIKETDVFQVHTTLPEQLKGVANYINNIASAIEADQLPIDAIEAFIGIAVQSLATLYETFDDIRHMEKN